MVKGLHKLEIRYNPSDGMQTLRVVTVGYACHEGNYAMRNRLSAARAREAKDTAKETAAKK